MAECLLKRLASATDQGEMYDALDGAVIGTGDFSKTVYVCSKCAVAVTVEYPSLIAPIEETGLFIKDDGEECPDLDKNSLELQRLRSFPETTPTLFD